MADNEADVHTFSDQPIRREGAMLEPMDRRAVDLTAEPTSEISVTQKLRATEDELLGKDVPRHDGKPERGAGSKYAALHPAHKAHLAAIEHLIAAEAEHAEAEARLNAVHAKVQYALERVDATEEASEAVGKEA